MFDDATTTALSAPLDRNLVATRRGPGNSTLSYLEGHEAINQANRIFGYGAWGVEPVGDPIISRIGDKTLYAVRVRVAVRDSLSYNATGTGVAEKDTAEEHEKAIKTAETDAMKRALRHFGDQFGNRLYDKDYVAPAQPAPQAQRDTTSPDDPGALDKLGTWMTREGVEANSDASLTVARWMAAKFQIDPKLWNDLPAHRRTLILKHMTPLSLADVAAELKAGVKAA